MKHSISWLKLTALLMEWNGAYTVSVGVRNPVVNSVDECLVSWCDRTEWNLANFNEVKTSKIRIIVTHLKENNFTALYELELFGGN